MTQQYQWPTTVAQMKVLAAELIRAAEIMGGDDEESHEVELVLAVASAGTVQDDDGVWNGEPILTVRLEEYPEEGVYPVDPRDPTGGRIDAPTPPASAQDDAKDERTRVMEIIEGVWDRATQIDDAADEVIDLLRAPAAGDARDAQDAARYRWLRDNIQPDHDLPGSFWLSDQGGESWDKTIDAAMEYQRQGDAE